SPKQRSMGIGMDLWAKRKDDSEFPVEVSLNYFKTEGKMFVMGLVTDITERYKAEEQVKKINEDLEKLVVERTQELEESRSLYQTVAKNFPNGTINILDKGLKYVFAEGSELLKVGLTSADLIGNSFISRLPAEIRTEVQEKLQVVFQGSPAEFEIFVNNVYYVISVAPLYNKDGNIDHILLVLQNISEKKKNESLEKLVEERTKELEESRRLYQIVARNFPDGTINVFDKELKYVFAEGSELFKFGITSEKLVGTDYITRLPAEVRDEVREKLLAVFNGTNTTFELQVRHNIYLISVVALHDADGNIDQILMVEQNITRKKKAEEDMKRALEKEKQLNELKSRFVSMASHEFRTPLSTILSSSSLVEKYLDKADSDPASVKENTTRHLKRIKSSVGNLTSILNDFLSLDKLEQGKVDIKPSHIQIDKFSEELIDEIQGTLKRGQKIIYKNNGDTSIYIDKQMLKNILYNLISNASKYSDEGSIIEFASTLDKTGLNLAVTDHGIGIPDNDQIHLFERFFRAKNVTNIQGTGLGLNIVKRYTDLLNGTISFSSSEGKGTTFTIQIDSPHLTEPELL
ncbi:MAG TPA: ATP-binding protein, partial [Bacteroidia bacterium]|nr:ATP-binding protein [Bacteroidia bacterium]